MNSRGGHEREQENDEFVIVDLSKVREEGAETPNFSKASDEEIEEWLGSISDFFPEEELEEIRERIESLRRELGGGGKEEDGTVSRRRNQM